MVKKARKKRRIRPQSVYGFVLPVAFLVVALYLMFSVSSKDVMAGDIKTYSDGLPVPGSQSKLSINAKAAAVSLETSRLPPGHVVTMWWLIFNHPENCTHPLFGYRCSMMDLSLFGGAPEVESSMVYAETDVMGKSNVQRFNGRLNVGDTSDALFGPGLTNIRGADIHALLRVHGPVVQGVVDGKSKEYGAGCNNAPPGTGGIPGDFHCEDFEFAAFQQ